MDMNDEPMKAYKELPALSSMEAAQDSPTSFAEKRCVRSGMLWSCLGIT